MFFCHNQGFKLLILAKNFVTFKGSDGVEDKKTLIRQRFSIKYNF